LINNRLCLIDTDILSYILKRKENVYDYAIEYLKLHKNFTISCIIYYEWLSQISNQSHRFRKNIVSDMRKISLRNIDVFTSEASRCEKCHLSGYERNLQIFRRAV